MTVADKSKNIGFDLDDVLLNFSDILRDHMNEKYKKNVQRDEINTFQIEGHFGISSIEARETIDNFFFHDDHLKAIPIKGSQEAIERLSKSNNLHIITAKPDMLEQITKEWLDKHFPNKFKAVYFANWFIKNEKKRNKSEICLETGTDIFIDDSLDTAVDVSSVGIPVLLFDKPWNQKVDLPDNVTRVYSWEEIEREVNNLI